MVTWKTCEYCNNFKVLYFNQSYMKTSSSCIRILYRLNNIKFLKNKINRLKQEKNDEKLQRYIFEACERYVSNPDSETEFDTIFEQCASEKSKKVKIKENGDRKSHQT